MMVFRTLRSVLTRNGYLLFAARSLRLMAYGWVAVALYKHLYQVGLTEPEIGGLFTGVLIGDLVSFQNRINYVPC